MKATERYYYDVQSYDSSEEAAEFEIGATGYSGTAIYQFFYGVFYEYSNFCVGGMLRRGRSPFYMKISVTICLLLHNFFHFVHIVYSYC